MTVGDGDSPGGQTNDYSLVENNIIYNSTRTAIAETGTTGPHNQYIDNLIYGGDTSISLNNGLHATGTIYADPKFIDNTGTATGNYQLQAISPARGAGVALAGVATDFGGTPRPQTGATDLGAHLYGGPTTVPPPPPPGPPSGGAVTAAPSPRATSVARGKSSAPSQSTATAGRRNFEVGPRA